METFEDDGTWIWVSFAPQCRLILDIEVGPRQQCMADLLIEKTSHRLASSPLFVSDGLPMYTQALLKTYGEQKTYLRTGLRGRPKGPEVVPQAHLKYAQVVKERQGRHLVNVSQRSIFGKNINPKSITTSHIERQKLTFRQDNNRISRKTIGFSRKIEQLKNHLTLFWAHFNFCRGHWSLMQRDETGITRRQSPAQNYGLIDHIWSMRDLLTFPFYKNINQL